MDRGRSKILQKSASAGKSVVYVMSRDQRVDDNFGLLRAQQYALDQQLPLVVVFCLHRVTGRAREHYAWMLAGLRAVEASLHEKHIPFMILIGDPLEKLKALVHHVNPAAIFFDQNPLQGVRTLQEGIARHTRVYTEVVDSHNIVPVWAASPKQEYAARTIRPKIHAILGDFLHEPKKVTKHPYSWPGVVRSLRELGHAIDELIASVPSNGQSLQFASGSKAAHHTLRVFLSNRLPIYADKRNDPNANALSGLSPYLHFGQISSLRAVLEVEKYVALHPELRKQADAFIEEIVVRKELSDNFCYYNNAYRSLKGAPGWALETLDKHRKDPREHMYDYKTLQSAATHDNAWNAAQRQLVSTGKIHGYMRMYWAKKVLEWTESPEQAHEFLVRLNDFYSIDGGDPNGYVGILWSIAGLHDRPWFERPIFGTVRYMNAAGLARKFDVDAYEGVA